MFEYSCKLKNENIMFDSSYEFFDDALDNFISDIVDYDSEYENIEKIMEIINDYIDLNTDKITANTCYQVSNSNIIINNIIQINTSIKFLGIFEYIPEKYVKYDNNGFNSMIEFNW